MQKHGLTFPCIIDSSTQAQQVMRDYKVTAWPTTYVIDRAGKIVSAWVGFAEDDEHIPAALKKLGLE